MVPPSDYLYSPQETIVPSHYNSYWRYYPTTIVPTPALEVVAKFARNNNIKSPKAIAGRLTRFESNNSDVLLPPGTAQYLSDYGYHLAQVNEHRPGPGYLPAYERHHLFTRNWLARWVRGIGAFFTVTLYQLWRQEECYKELSVRILSKTLDINGSHHLSCVSTNTYPDPDVQSILSTIKATLWRSDERPSGAYSGDLMTTQDTQAWLHGTAGPAARDTPVRTLTYKFIPWVFRYLHMFFLMAIVRLCITKGIKHSGFEFTTSTTPDTYCGQFNATWLDSKGFDSAQWLADCPAQELILRTNECYRYTPEGSLLHYGPRHYGTTHTEALQACHQAQYDAASAIIKRADFYSNVAPRLGLKWPHK
jgi:hypothetical protein